MTKFIERFSPRTRLIGGGVIIAVAAAIVGSALALSFRPVPATVAAAPVTIASVVAASPSVFGETIVTIRGQVAGVYGDSFTLKDASGQTLVNIGQRDGLFGQTSLVSAGQTVTVQGEYEEGAVRAKYLVTADGQAYAVGHRGGHGGKHHRRRGRDAFDEAATPSVTATETTKAESAPAADALR